MIQSEIKRKGWMVNYDFSVFLDTFEELPTKGGESGESACYWYCDYGCVFCSKELNEDVNLEFYAFVILCTLLRF